MSAHEERFRRLAVEVGAALESGRLAFVVTRVGAGSVAGTKAGISVRVSLDGAQLRVEGLHRKERPGLTVRRRRVVDALGQRLGTDAAQVLADKSFNARYELVVDEHSDVDERVAAHAAGALFADAAARDAVAVLERGGFLPVRIDRHGATWQEDEAPAHHLSASFLSPLLDAIAALAAALPEAAAARGSKADRPRLSARSWLRAMSTRAPLVAPGFVFIDAVAYLQLPGHAVDVKAGVGVSLVLVSFAVAFAATLAALWKTPGALARSLLGAVGLAFVWGGTAFVGLHAYNRVADRSAPAKSTEVDDASTGAGTREQLTHHGALHWKYTTSRAATP